jgi:hypothetical protein
MLAVVALVLIGAGIWAMKKYRMPLPAFGGVRTVVPKMSLLTVGGILIIALELWLIWALIGNPFSNPVAFVGTMVILGAVNIGLYHIYKTASAQVTIYLAYAALFLGGILGFVAVMSGPDSAGNLLSWGRNGVTESVNWLTDSDTTPGTVEVTATNYVGRANGSYTVRDDVWTVVEWPDGWCPKHIGGSGLLKKINDANNSYSVLSPSGTQEITFKTIRLGEVWKGVRCE